MATAMSVDDFDDGHEPLSEGLWYLDRDAECDAALAAELREALDVFGSRRACRDRKVSSRAEEFRVAINDLDHLFDDGHSDYGYEGSGIGEWDVLYLIAVSCLRLACLAFAKAVALGELLLSGQLNRIDEIVEARRLLRCAEPRVPPPSRTSRSIPDLALAPPLPRVALLSDDVMVALAA
jgi:hypothetical protein